jgi:hypothetical protein
LLSIPISWFVHWPVTEPVVVTFENTAWHVKAVSWLVKASRITELTPSGWKSCLEVRV